MFSKFSVNLIKVVPKLRPLAFYSSTNSSTPCGQPEKPKKSSPCGQVEKPKKDWRCEIAGPCDSEKILKFVDKHFIKDEPLFKALIPDQKPKILAKLFRGSLEQGLTVVARQCSDKQIIGVSINERSGKLDGPRCCKMAKEVADCNVKKLFEVLAIINSEPKMNEKLCQDEIFNVSVLSVCECHWGKGIGLDLVQKSLELARDKKFAFAKMNAASLNKSMIAEKLNFQKFWCISYQDALCRGDIKPLAMPEPPNTHVNVFFYDLKCLPKKC